MKKIEVYVSESGIPLLNPNDGVIVYGAIFKGNNEGGLFGDASTMEKLEGIDVEGRVYTIEEFFDGLCLDPEVFYQYYVKHKKTGVRLDNSTISRYATKDHSTFGTDEFEIYHDLGA